MAIRTVETSVRDVATWATLGSDLRLQLQQVNQGYKSLNALVKDEWIPKETVDSDPLVASLGLDKTKDQLRFVVQTLYELFLNAVYHGILKDTYPRDSSALPPGVDPKTYLFSLMRNAFEGTTGLTATPPLSTKLLFDDETGKGTIAVSYPVPIDEPPVDLEAASTRRNGGALQSINDPRGFLSRRFKEEGLETGKVQLVDTPDTEQTKLRTMFVTFQRIANE